MNKIDELVEWAAKIIEELGYDKYGCAKQILSHPDLALIDRKRKLPRQSGTPLHPTEIKYHAGYSQAQQDMTGYLPVIPITEALKKEEQAKLS